MEWLGHLTEQEDVNSDEFNPDQRSTKKIYDGRLNRKVMLVDFGKKVEKKPTTKSNYKKKVNDQKVQ